MQTTSKPNVHGHISPYAFYIVAAISKITVFYHGSPCALLYSHIYIYIYIVQESYHIDDLSRIRWARVVLDGVQDLLPLSLNVAS